VNENKNNELDASDSLGNSVPSSAFVHKSDRDAFKSRMISLISHFKPQGGVAEISRVCGLSEGVIRSWRDGGSDPSRIRCIQLAEGTGASLLWVVAGIGPMWAKDANVRNDQLAPLSQHTLKLASKTVGEVLEAVNQQLSPPKMAEAILLVINILEDSGLPEEDALPLARKALQFALEFRYSFPDS